MKQEIKPIKTNTDLTPFEYIKRTDPNGKEFWSGRELANILTYIEYIKFESVIEKAKQACSNSGENVQDHFVQLDEMVNIGSSAKRERRNVMLTRHACYLIAQNADPSKKIVAHAQTYFAVQTRKQELHDEERDLRLQHREEIANHNKKLAGAAKGAGVIEPRDYAIFQNYGYKGLYGGLTMKDIHHKKKLEKKEHILDHMGSTELAANLFRATQTEDKIKKERIIGKSEANRTHYEVGEKVRKAIKDIAGTMPENLPVAENIKKVKAKHKKSLKQLGN